ncbi:MAG TPA: hypothetical protein VEI50_15220 [Nitrospiraceae bacterium]|jgi:hypothetical protein|nr:hypothetical protein [Nitrospiraceae bacterium]
MMPIRRSLSVTRLPIAITTLYLLMAVWATFCLDGAPASHQHEHHQHSSHSALCDSACHAVSPAVAATDYTRTLSLPFVGYNISLTDFLAPLVVVGYESRGPPISI